MQQTRYNHQEIEEKWLNAWESLQLFQGTPQHIPSPERDKKEYLLFAFAYPSGSGLHVGHVESKTALDILARFKRMNGKDVLFPVGWDAFGLPAENYAIKTGVHPAETTKNAINTFRRQIKRLGISYDWQNEIATNHPEYYRWTQWLFLQLYKKGLAYQDIGMVNWCPSCQTVLANEQVVNGLCERCDSQVVQKELKQWYFKITQYKDELLSGLETVDWPEPTKHHQRNWIGKKTGVNITFQIADSEKTLTCFTTRIDTVFGVTFVVMSPEQFKELGLSNLLDESRSAAVTTYIENAFKKTEEERQIGQKDKTGVDTGLKAINPVNQEAVPILVADYVLGGVGTGAVMGVPAHDERDWAFAQQHQLAIKPVIAPVKPESDEVTVDVSAGATSEYGFLINSGAFSGQSSVEAQEAIVTAFPEVMAKTTTYKLRDWLISRQRYWGAPIPVVYDPEGKPHPVKEEHLPWTLPTDVDFKPTGESPLKSSNEFIERTERLYGKGWKPEYDTMDTFVDSSWYYLRYLGSRDSEQLADPETLKAWLPVDLYLIGPEHIVLHLLYSRFFTKFLRDEGYLNVDEPFAKMRHQGMILGPDGKKMSKSKGNVINPDSVVTEYGADTLRVYEMFMGPLEADKPWDIRAVAGVSRFLTRIYRLVQAWLEQSDQEEILDTELLKKLHITNEKLTREIPELKFNTAIASLMELVNLWEDKAKLRSEPVMGKAELSMFVRLLAPFAPFLAEELWQQLQKQDQTSLTQAQQSVHLQPWPAFDPSLTQADEIIIAVQVNGKIRGEVAVTPDKLQDKDYVLTLAKEQEAVQRWLDGKTLRKEIYIPGRIISLVVA